jgi:hypothetical protein
MAIFNFLINPHKDRGGAVATKSVLGKKLLITFQKVLLFKNKFPKFLSSC